MQLKNKLEKSVDNLEFKSKVENENSGIEDSELESLMSSSIESSLGNCSSTSISSESCSTSIDNSSGSITEEDENDGCFDDWEAIADAMNQDSDQPSAVPDTSSKPKATDGLVSDYSQEEGNTSTGASPGLQPKLYINCRAWRADDASRPQCLPSLSKQNCCSMNSEWQNSSAGITWSLQSAAAQPSSCPICYEDLDITDSRFFPCSCGFRLCLFCHKRILEADARCPGCRKCYARMNLSTSSCGDPSAF